MNMTNEEMINDYIKKETPQKRRNLYDIIIPKQLS